MLSAAKIALGGRKFVEEEEYPPPCDLTEGRSRDRRVGGSRHGGDADHSRSTLVAVREIENTIAKIMRAQSVSAEPNSAFWDRRGEAMGDRCTVIASLSERAGDVGRN